MRFACRKTTAKIHTYNILYLTAFQLQKLLRDSATVLRYTGIAGLNMFLDIDVFTQCSDRSVRTESLLLSSVSIIVYFWICLMTHFKAKVATLLVFMDAKDE
jgi:hypothetical protein